MALRPQSGCPWSCFSSAALARLESPHATRQGPCDNPEARPTPGEGQSQRMDLEVLTCHSCSVACVPFLQPLPASPSPRVVCTSFCLSHGATCQPFSHSVPCCMDLSDEGHHGKLGGGWKCFPGGPVCLVPHAGCSLFCFLGPAAPGGGGKGGGFVLSPAGGFPPWLFTCLWWSTLPSGPPLSP